MSQNTRGCFAAVSVNSADGPTYTYSSGWNKYSAPPFARCLL